MSATECVGASRNTGEIDSSVVNISINCGLVQNTELYSSPSHLSLIVKLLPHHSNTSLKT